MKHLFSIALLGLLLFLLSCNAHKSKYPTVVITTGYGKITAELYNDKAPKTVAAFLANVKAGVYKDGSFYRALKEDAGYPSGVVQGGINQTHNERMASLPFIEHEAPSATGLSHTNGTLSMARTTPGSAKTEFFICLGDQTQFDNSRRTQPDGLGYAAFGRVIDGMDVVNSIHAAKTNGEAIIDKIEIKDITVE